MDLKQLITDEKNMGKNPAMNYKVENLEDIDSRIFTKRVKNESLNKTRNEAIKLYQEENAGDVIALHYVAGRIKLEMRPHEFNVDLNNILVQFYDARNWAVVKYLGLLIISKSENSLALRILGDVASEEKDDDLMWQYYERYIKTDNKDKDIIMEVAKHFKSLDDRKKANAYYQRALLRMDVPQDNSKIENAFKNLLDLKRLDYQFFINYVDSTVAKLDSDFAFSLYSLLISELKKEKAELDEAEKSERRKNLENTVKVYKLMLEIKSEDEIRKAVVETLKEEYRNSSRLAECLKKYNIVKSANVLSEINEFEKEIAYSKGAFCYQKATRRVGLITGIDNTHLTVKYSGSEPEQKITLEAAFLSLVPLTNQNIKAIKKGVPQAKIKAKINAPGGISWLAWTLLYSADNNEASIRDMKAEVVPSIMSDDEWKKISEELKTELRKNEYVTFIPGSTDLYRLESYPKTEEEKIFTSFEKAGNNFYLRAQIMLEAMSNKEIDKSSDSLMDMADYFSMKLEGDEKSDVLLCSALILEIVSRNDEVKVQVRRSFEDIYKSLSQEERIQAFSRVEGGAKLKKEYVDKVIEVDGYPETLIEMMSSYIPYISECLKKMSSKDYYEYIGSVFSAFRGKIAEFVYFISKVTDDDLKKADYDRAQLTKQELRALQSFKNLDIVGETKKQRDAIKKELLKDRHIEKLIESAGDYEDFAELKSLIMLNSELDTVEKNEYKAMLSERCPELFADESKKDGEKIVRTVRGFLCLEESYNQKQEELKKINTVDMPQILKEINTARELGDLRENAEYQYAKEHKRELERRLGELNHDLNTVRIMKSQDVIPFLIGFGTKVKLLDKNENKNVTYTFLGRWESNPEEGIIDINAPLGKALRDHKEKDEVSFTINDKSYDYVILSVSSVL